MINSCPVQPVGKRLYRQPDIIKKGRLILRMMAVTCFCLIGQNLLAANSFVVGSVRVQLLSSSLVRLEVMGAEGFEDRNTFHVLNRNWPGTSYSSNSISGEVVI